MYVAQVYLETSVEYIFDICFLSFDSSHYMCGHMCTTTVTTTTTTAALP